MSQSQPDITTIGIDFGGTSVKIAPVRNAELIDETVRIPTKDFQSAEPLVDAIVEAIETLRKAHPSIAAIGAGVPGGVDFHGGKTYSLTNVPGWDNFPLRDILKERCQLPSILDNDANCMTYAELKFGAAKGLRNVVAITLGTGVGGGLIIEGQLYRGSHSAAGEVGQMSIDWNGVDGPYGNTGALERYVGNQQIADFAAERMEEAGRTFSPADCTPEALAQAAKDGDEIAHQIWHRVADHLGTALSSVIFLLNPDALVIGGGVAYAGDVLFEPLEKRVRSSLGFEFERALEIRRAAFGNTAGIIGSAALAAGLVEA